MAHEGELIVAVKDNNSSDVAEALRQGADPNVQDRFNQPVLWIASWMGYKKVVVLLLKAGAKVDQPHEDGATPLHMASLEGHKEVVEILLKAGAKVDQPMNVGATPLYLASQEGRKEVVEMLLRAGAEIDQPKNDGCTPLYVASLKNRKEVVDMLLRAGAKVDQPYKDGTTPLYLASQEGHKEVVEMLLRAGAKVDQPMNNGRTPLYAASCEGRKEVVEVLLKAGAEIDMLSADEYMPLYVAAMNGHQEIVELLYHCGAVINFVTPEGTALDVARKKNFTKIVAFLTNPPSRKKLYGRLTWKEKHSPEEAECCAALATNDVAKIRALLSMGKVPSDLRATSGKPILFYAAQKGYKDIVELLLNAHAKVDQPRNDGATPLFIASQNGHREVVCMLLIAGAKVDQPMNCGATPLFIASQKGHKEVIEMLLKAEVKVDQPMNDGGTPLSIASMKGHKEIVEMLLKAGAKVDQPDNDGCTSFYFASLKGHKEIVEILLKVGAKVDQPTKDGFTPLFVASHEGHIDIVELLYHCGANINIDKILGLSDDFSPIKIARQQGHNDVVGFLVSPPPRKNPFQEEERKRAEEERKKLAEEKARIDEAKKVSAPTKVGVMAEDGTMKVSFRIAAGELTYGRELGRGAFGVVYAGTYKFLEVAIKKLYAQELSPAMREEFLQEAGVMASLRHPNVIPFYGVCVDPGQYSMVMELKLPGSLYGLLHNNQDLPWDVRWRISMDIGQGLTYLHGENIYHRDLKSLNVLLDDHLHACVADFGLVRVKAESSATSKGQVAGTVRWMAPELFKRGAKYTDRADVYSYGMILWEIASRKLPYEDVSNEPLVMGWIQSGETEKVPDDCPKEFGEIITSCWKMKADERPAASELVVSLKGLQKFGIFGGGKAIEPPAAPKEQKETVSNSSEGASSYQGNLVSVTPAVSDYQANLMNAK